MIEEIKKDFENREKKQKELVGKYSIPFFIYFLILAFLLNLKYHKYHEEGFLVEDTWEFIYSYLGCIIVLSTFIIITASIMAVCIVFYTQIFFSQLTKILANPDYKFFFRIDFIGLIYRHTTIISSIFCLYLILVDGSFTKLLSFLEPFLSLFLGSRTEE